MINGVNKNSYDVVKIKPNNGDLSLVKNNMVKENNDNTKSIGTELSEIVNKIKNELEEAISIGFKIINEENISKSEEKFITINYPDIKKIAEKLKNEIKQLKFELKNCILDEKRNELIDKEILNVKVLLKKGYISESEAKLKLKVLNDVQKFSDSIKLENKKVEVIAIKLFKGKKINPEELKLINEKIPNINKLIKDVKKYINILKGQLKNCKTDKEFKDLITKELRILTNKDINGKTLGLNIKNKLKLEGLNELKKQAEILKLENKKIDVIVTKLIKNQKLTLKEVKLINEKIPNIKNILKEIREDDKILKYDVISCNSLEEKQSNIEKNIKYLGELFNLGKITDLELRLSLIYLNEIEREIKEKNNKLNWINPYLNLDLMQIGNIVKIIITLLIIMIIFKFI